MLFRNRRRSRAVSAVRQAIFPSRARRFVRKNAAPLRHDRLSDRYTAFSKKSLGFEGLIVARSVGLYRPYERFDTMARERWPDQPKGRLFGRLFHNLRHVGCGRNADEAIRLCDLLNLPNESELKELERAGVRKPAIIEPYGLSDQHRRALAAGGATSHGSSAK